MRGVYAPSGTRPPPGDLEVGSAWRYVSPARWFCCYNFRLLVLQAWSTRLLVMLQRWACWCFLNWARNVSI